MAGTTEDSAGILSPLTPDELRKIDAYRHACNDLASTVHALRCYRFSSVSKLVAPADRRISNHGAIGACSVPPKPGVHIFDAGHCALDAAADQITRLVQGFISSSREGFAARRAG
jgi:hypothetical protein